MPQQQEVYNYQGRRVRLLNAHPADPAIWIAQYEGEQDSRLFLGRPWLEINAPVTPGAPLATPEWVPTTPTVSAGAAAVAAAAPVAPPPVVDERPVCPACHRRYTGVLGGDHACAAIKAIRCPGCHIADPAYLGHPPRPGWLCERCVGVSVFLCRMCAQPIRDGGGYENSICRPCNILPATSVWAARQGQARGNDMTLETRSHRPFATEIECFLMPDKAIVPRTRLGKGWVEGDDGSIRADTGASERREFKSPPFKGDGGLRDLRAEVKAIRDMGFRANTSCGLHVHVDMTDTTAADRRALHTFARWIQNHVYKLVAPSRASASYCERLNAEEPEDEEDRYKWINITPAYEKYRTVEFRLHHGTTQPDRVVEWVKVCLRIVDVGLKLGRASPPATAVSLPDVLDMSAYERQYWHAVVRSLHGENASL